MGTRAFLEASGMDACELVGVELADEQWSEINIPARRAVGLKSEAFTFEGFTNKAELAVEADHASALHAPAGPTTGVAARSKLRGQLARTLAPRRGCTR